MSQCVAALDINVLIENNQRVGKKQRDKYTIHVQAYVLST